MSSKIFITFIFGVAVGSAITHQYFKKKYEKIAQTEIDSVKEVFSKRDISDTEEQIKQTKDKPNIIEYAEMLRKRCYTDYSRGNSKNEEEIENVDQPYVISPDDFGSVEDYLTICLVYYSDQIVADDNDDIVENIEDIIGFESLTHFGEYEDDSLFVRNDRLKCDYEILLDQRKYSDIVNRKPHQMEDR
ncbi:hypothetical protein FACS1894132_04860 [Clostridia bacterium]|nr:hypothetical protein FACS1894132_04860 [Clostridia bacterium]